MTCCLWLKCELVLLFALLRLLCCLALQFFFFFLVTQA